ISILQNIFHLPIFALKSRIQQKFSMQRYKIKVEYLGTPFVGWQSQKEGLTVQDVVNNALFQYTQQRDINAYASGRTDAGVHATGQICHVDFVKARPI